MHINGILSIKPVSDFDILEMQSYRSMRTSRIGAVIVEKKKKRNSYYNATRRMIDLLEKEMECCNLATD
jgi:hypothetical protein